MVSSDFDGPFSDRVKEACRKILKKGKFYDMAAGTWNGHNLQLGHIY